MNRPSKRQRRRRRRDRTSPRGAPQRRIREVYDIGWEGFVDPFEDLFDADGTRWLPLAGRGDDPQPFGGIADEQHLRQVRSECRHLAAANEFAINGHENRISYIVGAGHTYRAQARKGREVSPEMISAAQDVLDEFVVENAWHRRQQEIVRRRDRDGEVFLRLFVSPQGLVRVRFVEPGQVSTPVDRASDPSASFGIETDPLDVESVHAYWIDGQRIAADQVQHRKANVDANVKRGLPLFFAVRKNLRRAEKVLRNMSAVTEIQSAIALIRKHRAATKSGVQSFVAGAADKTATHPLTGRTAHLKRYAPGTILDTHGSVDYEFPAAGIDAGRFVTVLQAELRAVASRLVMPEFMFTSDASSANYASTLVSEGPAMRMFLRLQAEQIADDLVLLRRALETAARIGRLPGEELTAINIQAEPPSLKTRDELEEVEAYRIELDAGVLSPQTWSQRRGLDYEQEQANLAVHRTE